MQKLVDLREKDFFFMNIQLDRRLNMDMSELNSGGF